MISKRNLRASALLLFLVVASCAQAQEALRFGPYFWPTPNQAFLKHGKMEGVLQPTVSGNLSSGLFGCVRNSSHRFHEGLDLKATSWDRRREATDPIFAFHDGVVRYVSLSPGNSSYGRYIVVEHPQIAPGFISLYAHLKSAADGVVPGASIRGGQRIATMGRSAGGYSIPRERAHLHFELGFWLGPDFQKWYDQQGFGSKNDHGAFNGMNIVGLDTWELCSALRRGGIADAWEFVMTEQVAVDVFVRDTSVPALLKVNPSLMEDDVIPVDHAGWRVELTWYGLPTGFKALTSAEMSAYEDWLTVEAIRPDLLEGKLCMELATGRSHSGAGAKAVSLMKRLFVK